MTDNVYCLVKILQKDEKIFAAVQFEIKLFDFFYQSKRLTDYIYTNIYCKLSKCTRQTPCSYKHYLVIIIIIITGWLNIYSTLSLQKIPHVLDAPLVHKKHKTV